MMFRISTTNRFSRCAMDPNRVFYTAWNYDDPTVESYCLRWCGQNFWADKFDRIIYLPFYSSTEITFYDAVDEVKDHHKFFLLEVELWVRGLRIGNIAGPVIIDRKNVIK